MSIVEMKVPTIGESITEVTLSQWLKRMVLTWSWMNRFVNLNRIKPPSSFPPKLPETDLRSRRGDDLEIGALVAKIDTSVSAPAGGDTASAPPAKEEEAPAAEVAAPVEANGKDSYAKGHPSPAASKILAEANV
jgi:2-oxoglutarate dehydrogenase E2 component (dihydrolipoamide succinyltransferase)